MAESNPNDFQIGGDHYKAAYQHWDLAADNNLGYYPGVITKYITRVFKKNGVQDVEKALHYTRKLISVHRGTFPLPSSRRVIHLDKFIKDNNLGTLEYLIFSIMMTYTSIQELEAVVVLLFQLLEMAKREEEKV